MTSPGSATAAPGARAAPRPPGVLAFLAIILALLAASWVAVGALLAPVLPGGWATILAAAVLVTVVPFGALIGTRVRGIYPGRFFRLTVFRFLWYAHFLLLLAMLAGIAGMLLGALGALFGLGTDTIGNWGRVAMGLTATVYVVGMVAGYWGSRQLVVTELDVTHPALPVALNGLKVVQLSDVHVGPHTLRRTLAAIVRHTHDATPDLIAITGDLIDDFDEDVEQYAAAFGHLAAPLGVWVVAGNHDIYANWPNVRARLARLPQRILMNEHVMVAHRGTAFAIAGTGDPAAGRARGARDAQRAQALGTAGDPGARLVHGVAVPRTRDGLAGARRVAALHSPRHQLLGDSVPARRAAGGGGDYPAKRRGGAGDATGGAAAGTVLVTL